MRENPDDAWHMKTLVVALRGIPGSGKSRLAAEMEFWSRINRLHCRIVSADMYFMRRNGYEFDPRQLERAHEECWNDFMWCVDNNFDLVVVDNTNIEAREYGRYADYARRSGAAVLFVQFSCVDEGMALQLSERCFDRPFSWTTTSRFDLLARNRIDSANNEVIEVDPYEGS